MCQLMVQQVGNILVHLLMELEAVPATPFYANFWWQLYLPAFSILFSRVVLVLLHLKGEWAPPPPYRCVIHKMPRHYGTFRHYSV